MTDPKPMDPERLAVLRADINEPAGKERPLWSEVDDLLDDRDHWRARAYIRASDVRESGLTIEQVHAWLRADGWTVDDSPAMVQRDDIWTHEKWKSVWMGRCRGVHELADGIQTIADRRGVPHLDILDEMAATKTETPT